MALKGELCYYHNKVLFGLITPQHEADGVPIYGVDAATQEQLSDFESMKQLALNTASRFSKYNNFHPSFDLQDANQTALCYLWQCIRERVFDDVKNPETYFMRSCLKQLRRSIYEPIHLLRIELEPTLIVYNLEDDIIEKELQSHRATFLETFRYGLSGIDKKIFDHNILPIEHKVYSLRLLGKKLKISNVALAKRKLKILTKLHKCYKEKT
jgi:hypothetical protein